MKLFNKMLAVAFAGAFGAPMSASAITIDGITFSAGSVFERINLAEGKKGGGPIAGIGDELVGIGKITVVEDALANDTWVDGQNGRELTVYFEKFIAETIAITTSVDSFGNTVKEAAIGFSGGVVKIFSDTARDFTDVGAQALGIASATNGTLFLDLVGSPVGGVGPSGNPITLISSSKCTGVTCNPLLQSSTIAGGLTGLGNLDVVGGSAAAYFDTNMFGCTAGPAACPDDADKVFSSSGQLNPSAPANSWAFRGTGEVQDVAIPEPGTLALLGLGMLGMGAARRRKA